MSCLKCLKYTMCMVNFIFFICGAAIFGIGVYMMASTRFSSLLPSLQAINIANTLFIIGIIITCVSFLGFLGALKENRCLLISFFILLFIVMLAELAAACMLLMYESELGKFIEADLKSGLEKSIKNRKRNTTEIDDWDTVQETFQCCGIHNFTEWGNGVPQSCFIPANRTNSWPLGCLDKLKNTFEDNLMHTGIGVIIVCIIEVLGMCFSMTLFCHISRSGLGYK